MQADTPVTPEIIEQTYPFSTLKGAANVLIFPNLEAGNIAYKLLAKVGGATDGRSLWAWKNRCTCCSAAPR